ncbi:CoA-binding protein [Motiliproteus sp. MSK22-1]|uniref:CoA-binding protein n=1 Tax=Motiliproteus sp. MSK22-1 TaxID=1897630 RepID=UPI00097637DD|nr:CoA-binding protein [Motiliproteus sp. MSK22-1]OMH39036.1 hypothetical protein BGP75_04795 [Motiliproteus sp. MSK22-1]
MHLQYDDEYLKQILTQTQVIALVGASPKPHRDSHRVMAYLQARGYKVIPVNPRIGGEVLLGEHVYSKLEDIPGHVDMVDIFRNSQAAGEVCEEAIRIGAKSIWMQLGVINGAAARRASEYGLQVVMDRCPKIEIPRLGLD